MPLRASFLPHDGRMPSGTTDTHVHVFDPTRFAYCAQRSYTPGPATVEGLLHRHGQLGMARVVLVQPSVYGSNNACLLDALARLGTHRARGIVVVDWTRTSRAELLALHDAGVRGVRLNLQVLHETDPGRTRAQLERAAAVVDLPGWCVQVHCAAALLPTVAQSLDSFRVPLVLDHFGGVRATDAPGALLALLDSGRVFVKLSAFYRASSAAPHHADLTPLARTLIQARPNRLLWGSDWPHTGGGHGHGHDRDASRIEPFRVVDLAAHLAALKSWASDAQTLHQILVCNPARLYGFPA